ncbi:MAG: hypothetical protein AAF802_21260 [Planctomycetota bacterium]
MQERVTRYVTDFGGFDVHEAMRPLQIATGRWTSSATCKNGVIAAVGISVFL